MKASDTIRTAMRIGDQSMTAYMQSMSDLPLAQPTPRGGCHPLWVLGHLTHAEGGLRGMIRGEPNPVEHWTELFAGGTEPTTDADGYPSFEEVFAQYREMRQGTLKLLQDVSDAELAQAPKAVPAEVEEIFRTVCDVLVFIPMHQMHHCGHVADARRAAGRKPLFM